MARKRYQAASTDPSLISRAVIDAFRKLDPRTLIKNPVIFVTAVVAALVTVLFVRDLVNRPAGVLYRTDRGLAVVHGAVRQFRRGHRRGSRARPGRRPSAGAYRHTRQAARDAGQPGNLGGRFRGRSGTRRPRAGRSRRCHPGRRRRDRGHRLGQRGGGHRRIGAGDPRVRRRPLGGHRRHDGPLRLDRGAHHLFARLVLPRPHDRAGRGCRAAEDAERDRAEHPARRPDHRLPGRGRDADRALAPTPAPTCPCRSWWRCW